MHKSLRSRLDRLQCGPGAKPCGDVCIRRSYNCELYNESSKNGKKGDRNRNLGALAGLGAAASTVGLMGLENDLSSSAGNKRAALLAGAVLGGGAALGLGMRAKKQHERAGSALIAQSENSRNPEERVLMKAFGSAQGGSEQYARQQGWIKDKKRKKKRSDSIWAAGFENERSESI